MEHDAEEIWATQAATIAEVLARARATVDDLAAVGITNQRETTVLWDRATGRPVAPAIVWQDRRTADACARLKAEGHEPEVTRRTGLLLDPYFSGTKLAWLLDSDPGAARARRARRARLRHHRQLARLEALARRAARHRRDQRQPHAAVRHRHAASGTSACSSCSGIPRAVLPRVVPSMLAHGEAFASLGGREIPLGGIAGDQQAALFGQACFTPGMAKNTYGTGCFMLMNTGREPQASANRLLTTVAWHTGEPPLRARGRVFVGGAAVQWLRDGLGFIANSADVEALAASVPDTGGVYLVPAFTGLGSPHWDAYARGTIVGLTRGTTKAHIARAALEAIAFQTAEVLLAMQRDARQPLRRAARGRRRHRQRPADAVPGGPARRAGGAPEGHGDDGARRGLSRRACRGLLGLDGRGRRELAGGPPLRARAAAGCSRGAHAYLGARRRALARLARGG